LVIRNVFFVQVKLLVPRIQSVSSKDRTVGNQLTARFNALNAALQQKIAPAASEPAKPAEAPVTSSTTQVAASSPAPAASTPPAASGAESPHSAVIQKLTDYKNSFDTMEDAAIWAGEGVKLWKEFQLFGQQQLSPLSQLKPFPAELVSAFQTFNGMNQGVPKKFNEVNARKPREAAPAPVAVPKQAAASAPKVAAAASAPKAAIAAPAKTAVVQDYKSKRLPYPEAEKLRLMNPSGYLTKYAHPPVNLLFRLLNRLLILFLGLKTPSRIRFATRRSRLNGERASRIRSRFWRHSAYLLIILRSSRRQRRQKHLKSLSRSKSNSPIQSFRRLLPSVALIGRPDA
jgi:hypothetical protein